MVQKEFYITAILILLLSSCSDLKKTETQRPNVLMICVDDLRPELACYGNDLIVSPNIDKLASEGCLFKRHYVQCAICGPSRSTLMTGKFEQGWDLWTDLRKSGVEPEHTIALPHLFKKNGYHTVGIGKITHQPGGVLDENQMVHQIPFCWDTTYTAVGKWKTPWRAFFAYANGDAHNTAMKIGVETPRLPFETAYVEDDGYPDGLNALEAIKHLRGFGKKEKPFFMAIGFYKPHLPFNAPKKYWDLYNREEISLAENSYPPQNSNTNYCLNESPELTTHYPWPDGPGKVTPKHARELKHAYYACVSYIDAQIGKILDELKKQGLDKNTIVLLWSDHGWHLGEHGIFGKMTNFEVATNSPLILKAPGVGKIGSSTNSLVETVDIYPTLAELCRLESASDLDGKSLVPILKNPETSVKPYARSFYYRNNALGKALKTDSYRIVRWATENDNTVAIELFDHRNDPGENINIGALDTELTDSLLNLLNNTKFLSSDKPFVNGWE
ncbi:sulfatase [Draconibacterium sp.]|nr:sulfatase [Draconibacterium sp.]